MMEKYLLDTSIFITPYKQYYPFDFARSFWDQLADRLTLDNIMVLDVVVSEVSEREDELSEWIKSLRDFHPITVKNEQIVVNYGKVLNYIQQSPLYKKEALSSWANKEVADPWLIAAAMNTGAKIITIESTSGKGLSPSNASRNPKIPDVAEHFGVKCENLFAFMRETKFIL